MEQYKRYKVLDAQRKNVIHYHGSWFEYQWMLVLRDTISGKTITGFYDTWDNYEILKGKYVQMCLVSDTFKVS